MNGQKAATTTAVGRAITHIALTLEDSIGEIYETSAVYSPKTHETAVYQIAVKMMLEQELDHGHKFIAATVWYEPRESEPIDRMTLHIRAGEEAIAQREVARTMKAITLIPYKTVSDADYENNEVLNQAAYMQRADLRENVQAFLPEDSGLVIAARNDPEPGTWTLYTMSPASIVQEVVPKALINQTIEDAVRERTADLEMRLQNREEQIADLDKHRHDLYQERDELLHRIEAAERGQGGRA